MIRIRYIRELIGIVVVVLAIAWVLSRASGCAHAQIQENFDYGYDGVMSGAILIQDAQKFIYNYHNYNQLSESRYQRNKGMIRAIGELRNRGELKARQEADLESERILKSLKEKKP